jgi:hypothetical protein
MRQGGLIGRTVVAAVDLELQSGGAAGAFTWGP